MPTERTWFRPDGSKLCRSSNTDYAFAKAAKEQLPDLTATDERGGTYSGGPAYQHFKACDEQRRSTGFQQQQS